MTEPNLMLEEEIRAQNFLSATAVRTKTKFDERMRATVKEAVSNRFLPEAIPVESARQEKYHAAHIEFAERIGDKIFGMDSSRKLQLMKAGMEEINTRPVRIHRYMLKLVDKFPAEHLIHLLMSSLRLCAEDTIRLYEANKGEAESNDYYNEPTELDLSSIEKS